MGFKCEVMMKTPAFGFRDYIWYRHASDADMNFVGPLCEPEYKEWCPPKMSIF
jgi:hypothetical protein